MSGYVSVYDVIEFLYEEKKYEHAKRVVKLVGELKLLQGKLERFHEEEALEKRREKSND